MAYDVTISTGTANGAFSGGNPDTFTPTAPDATADVSMINAALGSGDAVVVNTGSGGMDPGNITVSAAVDGSMGAGSLSLNAVGELIFDASVALGSTATLALAAGASGIQEIGNVAISAGALSVSASGGVSLGVTDNQIGSVTGFTADGDSLLATGGALSISGAVNVGAHALTFESNGNLTFSSAASLTAGQATLISQGALTLSGPVSISTGLNVQAAQASTISGVVSGAGMLTQSGVGVLTLSATNTYMGGTTVSGGAELVASSAHNNDGSTALGSGAVTLDAGAISSDGYSLTNDLFIASGGGTVEIDGAGDSFTIAGNITGAGDLTLMGGGGAFLQFGGAASSGVDTHTGATALTGDVQLYAIKSLSAASAVEIDSGATLYAQSNQTLGSLSGDGAVNAYSGSASVTTGASGASSTFSGVISNGGGAISLTKTGAGVFTLTGADTYTGGTTISGGTLQIGNGGAAGSIMGNVVDNATLRFFHSGATSFGGVISGTGAVVVTGQLTLSGANTYSGGTTLLGGITKVSADDNLGAASGGLNFTTGSTLEATASFTSARAITLAGTSIVAVDTGDTLTLSGAISNGASANTEFANAGGGTLILSGTDTYTGFTAVGQGTLIIDGAAAGTQVVLNDGVFGGVGTIEDMAAPGGAGAVTVAPGDVGATGVLHTGALLFNTHVTLAEQIGGTTAGTGYDQIDVANGFAGAVTLNGATLNLSLANGFTPANDQTYVIIDNEGSSAVSGQFAGLAEGATVMLGSVQATISYHGGDGNDVTLSTPRSAPPPPPTPPPSGPPAGAHILTPGEDTYQAGSAGEIVYGEGGSDTLLGGAGADTLVAGGYPGQATQGSTSDHTLIEGGGGNDSLVGGIGHDQIFGQMGNDHVTVIAGSQGASVYGGQGDDVIDASQSNAPNYLSGDIGADTIMSGAGFETVLGGQGDDVIVGSTTAGAGSLQLLFGNQGADHISYAAAGSVEMFGGQDGDTLSVITSGEGQTHLLFGNLGNDTLTASGGYNSLYGGQGDDVVTASGAGHNYLSGDIGNDMIAASAGGFDTVRGGPGADTITLSTHASNAGDMVLVGAGDSTATSAADESNLDHISGFNFASDHIVVAGHAAGTAANVTAYMDSAANASEAQAFASAYLYAFGDGTAAHAAHVGATEYLAVAESYDGTQAVYVFTADHTAVAFTGVTAASFQPGAIAGG